MMRRGLTLVTALGLMLGLGAAPAALAAPADGNGNKEVTELNIPLPGFIDCGGDLLDLHVGGWFQFSEFRGNGNKNIDHSIVHIELTYTNANGDMFFYQDVGTDKLSLDGDGNLVLHIVGRVSDAFGTGISVNGRAVVINFDDSTLTANGNVGPSSDEQACAALT